MKPGQTKLPWARSDRPVTLDELAWLDTPAGRAVCLDMAAGKPADTPAAIERWRWHVTPEHVAAAWMQVTLRRAARAKFSRADKMLFDRVGLEQATDEVIAEHKARRFAGLGRVADLCCGIGGDTLALARCAEVMAIDWSPVRVAMAQHNVEVYGGRATGRADDVIFVRPEADAIHIDPDRRAQGARRHAPEFSSPDLGVLQEIVRHYPGAAVKLSPGADFGVLPFDAEIELISHHGECKQAVAWTGRFKQARLRATALPGGESLSASHDEAIAWPAPRPLEPGVILYEPDPAVIRANLVGVAARRFNLSPVDEQIAFLLGDIIPPTSLLTPVRVIDWMDFAARRTRAWLVGHDIGSLEIKTRGFAGRPEQVLKQLRPTGSRAAVLFLTRIQDKPTAILAERVVR
jgi:SAM-dependent methyltransferase